MNLAPPGGTAGAERTEGTSPERLRVLRVVEVLNLVFWAVDAALHGPTNVRAMAGRAIVSAALLAADLALSRLRSPRRLRTTLVAAVVTGVAGFGLLALGTGGADSAYVAFLAFVPIVITIVVPDEPAVPLAAGLAASAFGLAVTAAAGGPAARLGFTAAAFGSCAFYGTASAVLTRRMRRREHAAAAAQARAIADLAASERLRLESERLAAVGRLATAFAHEVNNPLASVSANLRYVERGLARSDLDLDQRSALLDAREALERIRRTVADLRSVAVAPPGEAVEVPIDEAVDRAVRRAAERAGRQVLRGDAAAGDAPVHARAQHLVEALTLLIGLVAQGASGADEADVAVSTTADGDGVHVVVERRSAPAAGEPCEPLGPADRHPHLGLALSRELVSPWGGRIAVSLGRGGDARAVLTLPRSLQ